MWQLLNLRFLACAGAVGLVPVLILWTPLALLVTWPPCELLSTGGHYASVGLVGDRIDMPLVER